MKVGDRVRVVKSFHPGVDEDLIPVGLRGTIVGTGTVFHWLVEFDDGRATALNRDEISPIPSSTETETDGDGDERS